MVKFDSSIAFVFIIRNVDELPLFVSAKNLGSSEVLIVESIVLLDGLQANKFYGHTKILVEGYSKILIDIINGK